MIGVTHAYSIRRRVFRRTVMPNEVSVYFTSVFVAFTHCIMESTKTPVIITHGIMAITEAPVISSRRIMCFTKASVNLTRRIMATTDAPVNLTHGITKFTKSTVTITLRTMIRMLEKAKRRTQRLECTFASLHMRSIRSGGSGSDRSEGAQDVYRAFARTLKRGGAAVEMVHRSAQCGGKRAAPWQPEGVTPCAVKSPKR